jgi:hypothetical protein
MRLDAIHYEIGLLEKVQKPTYFLTPAGCNKSKTINTRLPCQSTNLQKKITRELEEL